MDNSLMPTYHIWSKKEDLCEEQVCSYSSLEERLKDTDWVQVFDCPKCGDKHTTPTISGVNLKPDDSFRDVLRSIHKGAGMRSKVNTF